MSTRTAEMPKNQIASPSATPFKFLSLSPKELKALNSANSWSLSESELATISAHFKRLDREPTRGEIETIAQTWSEHCKHKTFGGTIRYSDGKKTRIFENLFDETIVRATRELKSPWCLSVFKDNAGIVSFGKGKKWGLAIKVETHNHPCAIEPYGGAETGVGGVIRDVLGAGLGAKPVLNTDVFCFAPPSCSKPLPEGTLHPKRTLRNVVSGVRDYGNRMGIPTAGGAIHFDDDYRLNPLVFVGTAGIIPTSAIKKAVKPGDLIVSIGGRTGRDGIHGATFSSAKLEASPTAVQIGHPLNEKKLLDALLRARDKKLFNSVTDCGAGGFSSAIGELGASTGANVNLNGALLKATDLKPWEIWVSESQERMVLSVPPKNLKALEAICAIEGCEVSVIGEFTKTGRLEVSFRGKKIVDLDMKFLHRGLPRNERRAVWQATAKTAVLKSVSGTKDMPGTLTALLSHPNVCSREWVIRQYDHEVQAGTVIKPLQGVRHDGPGDACVIWPQAATDAGPEDFSGFAVSHGLNPYFGKTDPYQMALACADEALRNLLCVGADISKASFLDNFCWGNPDDPAQLGSFVRAALGCYDAAKGFKVPFISGKDSFNNHARDVNGKDLSIPGTLLITAVAPVPDIRRTLTMDFKGPGNALFLIGKTSGDLGASLYQQLYGRPSLAPTADLKSAWESFKALQAAIAKKLVLSAHDLSEGGLGVTAAEMAFSGEFGASLDLYELIKGSNTLIPADALLFSEAPSRILVEVSPQNEAAFMKIVKRIPIRRIGATIANPIIKVADLDGSIILEEPLASLKSAWQKALPESLS